MWEEGQSWTCPHCNRECIIQRNKPMDLTTHKLHTCNEYLMKVRTGLIKPKRENSLMRSMRMRTIFSIQRKCEWCGANWVYNEGLEPDDRLIHCPQCCDKRGDPLPEEIYSHPKYGYAAMVKWAKENGKIIPEHLRKYL